MPNRAFVSFTLATFAALALVALAVVTVFPGTARTAAPGPTAIPALDGKALFLAKGCAACHQHAAVSTGNSASIGPNLTNYRNSPDFLRRWLADPQAVRPETAPAYGPSGVMPNLHLSPDEIEALIAFINSSAAGQ
ncbi:MAG: c-type cytochrome [Thermomicrobiales bacterium]